MTTLGSDRRLLQLVVIGRHGSGKGVQCARLADRYGLEHIAPGDLLRRAVADGTPLGRSIELFVVAGAPVPDEIVTGVVAEAMGHAAAGSGTVLDGYPRTVDQMVELDALLAPGGIDVVLHLDVPRSIVLDRLTERGGPDDNDEAIGRRLSEHARVTAPLLEWLDERALLVEVNGVGTPDEVAVRVAAAVDAGARLLTTGGP